MWYFFKLGVFKRLNYVGKEVMILLNSRIIQFMMIMPLMYLSYTMGRQLYIEYHSFKYPGYYIKPASPIKDKFKGYVASVVGEVLTDKNVEKEGLNFLSKLFTEK